MAASFTLMGTGWTGTAGPTKGIVFIMTTYLLLLEKFWSASEREVEFRAWLAMDSCS